jgi:hypothetical protein
MIGLNPLAARGVYDGEGREQKSGVRSQESGVRSQESESEVKKGDVDCARVSSGSFDPQPPSSDS